MKNHFSHLILKKFLNSKLKFLGAFGYASTTDLYCVGLYNPKKIGFLTKNEAYGECDKDELCSGIHGQKRWPCTVTPKDECDEATHFYLCKGFTKVFNYHVCNWKKSYGM